MIDYGDGHLTVRAIKKAIDARSGRAARLLTCPTSPSRLVSRRRRSHR
jgi:hypothetical protein